jgi:DNA-binding transcriptional LysR family regulator
MGDRWAPAFVRILTTPQLELILVWTDPLVVALPAAHPLAAHPVLSLEQLADLPARLVPRQDNPPFHDLIAQAADRLTLSAPFTNLQDTLAVPPGPPTARLRRLLDACAATEHWRGKPHRARMADPR